MSMTHLISMLVGFHIAYTVGVPNLFLNMYPFSISIDELVPLKFPMTKSLSKSTVFLVELLESWNYKGILLKSQIYQI